jgi:hypothetical protein
MSDINKLMRAGQYAEALTKTDAVLAKHPRDAQLRFTKGLILAEQNRSAEAIAVFTKLTEDFPDLPEPYNNLAVLYAADGQYDKARAALDMAMRTNPTYATALENLGDVYAKLASQAYDKALQIDPGANVPQPKLTLLRSLNGNTTGGTVPRLASAASAQRDAKAKAEAAAAEQQERNRALAAEKLAQQAAADKAEAEKTAIAKATSEKEKAQPTRRPPTKPLPTRRPRTRPRPKRLQQTRPPPSVPRPRQGARRAAGSRAGACAKGRRRQGRRRAEAGRTAGPEGQGQGRQAGPRTSRPRREGKSRPGGRREGACRQAGRRREGQGRQGPRRQGKGQGRSQRRTGQGHRAGGLEWLGQGLERQGRAQLPGPLRQRLRHPRGASRKEWAEERRARIEDKGRISVKVSNATVSINGNIATVRYRQIYNSDRLTVDSRKTLIFVKQGNRWLIKQERSGG